MQGDLKTRILYLEEASNVKGKAADSRIEQLKAKEMIVQVQSQYLTQKDLENQINVVQYVAEQLVESINAALPSIKSNFIDQISINAGLNQMKELKESVDMTRRMTLELQQQAFNDTKEIMSEISKSGVGFTEEEMNMIEKLNKEKQVFQNKMTSSQDPQPLYETTSWGLSNSGAPDHLEWMRRACRTTKVLPRLPIHI